MRGIECRKDQSSLKKVLKSHYLKVHGSSPLRGLKRKFVDEN